jgi:HK97 family phage portal protein
MGLMDFFRGKTVSGMQLITDTGSGYFTWNGKLYQSDIIRSAIRPYAKAMGKLVAKHIRETIVNEVKQIKVNPEAYMRFLLEEPNPYMSGQVLQEKIATQWKLNNNAFILIVRDEFGYPTELYPVPATTVQSLHNNNVHYYKFYLRNGRQLTVAGADIIHLRRDFYNDDIFGEHPGKALESVMEIINASDQARVNAVKNSALIRWILKFKSALRPEDMAKQLQNFTSQFLSFNNNGGAIVSDSKYDVEEVKNQQYVPQTSQMQEATERVYRFFNTNEKIINSSATEDEMVSYFETEIEPDAMQMSNEFTRKLFTRKERGYGNRIVFEASSLQFATLKTKLELVQMVDRGAMNANEWRYHMNMAPIDGGDVYIRRLDTAALSGGGDNNAKKTTG